MYTSTCTEKKSKVKHQLDNSVFRSSYNCTRNSTCMHMTYHIMYLIQVTNIYVINFLFLFFCMMKPISIRTNKCGFVCFLFSNPFRELNAFSSYFHNNISMLKVDIIFNYLLIIYTIYGTSN